MLPDQFTKAIEELEASEDVVYSSCMEGFARLCERGAARGWHEANGGNLSYLMDEADVDECEMAFHPASRWMRLEHPVPTLAGRHVIMTASGAYLSNVSRELYGVPSDREMSEKDDSPEPASCGIIELDGAGAAWRIVWGFECYALPSSELETHLAAHEVGLRQDGDCRVVYHAHAPQAIALSAILEPDARTWTRALWQIMTETIVVFPQGIGVVPWMIPGSPELARATIELMGTHKACVWTNHGIMTRAASFDEAFGQVETIDKSAGIYLQARAACGGAEPRHLVTDAQLRSICERYGIVPNPAFFD